MRLSAALIVRDESKHLPECLSSLAGIADEVVVVDTGSTDNTRQIAKDGGVRLFDFEWIDDYAAARNEALRHCRGEWVLSVDADERYRACPREILDPLLCDESKAACSTLFRIRADFTSYRRVRLFRNHELIRFKGIIHENVLAGIERYSSEYGAEIGESPLFADHVGYDFSQSAKNRRSLPLLLRCAEQEPGRSILWCHLANVYASLGDAEAAERCWKRAVEAADNHTGAPGLYDSIAYLGLLEWLISRREDVSELLRRARKKFPGNLQLLWFEGRRMMEDGHYRAAIQRFEELIAARQHPDFDRRHGNPSDDPDHWFGYDKRLFGVLPAESLATCHLHLDQYQESLRYLDLAARHRPESRELLLKRRLCEELLQRSDPSSK